MRWAEMFPHSTLRRRSGFFWSFRLEMRLRRRLLYFTSVDLNSWKICRRDEQSRTKSAETHCPSVQKHKLFQHELHGVTLLTSFQCWCNKVKHTNTHTLSVHQILICHSGVNPALFVQLHLVQVKCWWGDKVKGYLLQFELQGAHSRLQWPCGHLENTNTHNIKQI